MYSLPILFHMVFQKQMAFPNAGVAKGWWAFQKFHGKPVWNQSVIKSLDWNKRNWLWNWESILTANVLPEPVCAIPTISRPLIAMGHPCAWIEVGSLNPNFLKMYKKLYITYSRGNIYCYMLFDLGFIMTHCDQEKHFSFKMPFAYTSFLSNEYLPLVILQIYAAHSLKYP